MKSKILIALVLGASHLLFSSNVAMANETAKGEIQLAVSPELCGAAQFMTDEFNASAQSEKISLLPTQGTSVSEMQASGAKLCLVSSNNFSMQEAATNWSMVIGREVIVPVMNADHPYREAIYKSGISAKCMKELLLEGNGVEWSKVAGEQTGFKIPVYVADDAQVRLSVSKFLGVNDDVLSKTATDDVLSKVKLNKLAIGFCKFNAVGIVNELIPEVVLLPFDANGDGILGKVENIYSNVEAFNRGVWAGKYPKNLVNNVYLVAVNEPVIETGGEFAMYTVTKGQEILVAAGFGGLLDGEILADLSSFEVSVPETEARQNVFSTANIVVVGAVMLLIALVLLLNVNWKKKVSYITDSQGNSFSGQLTQSSAVEFPEGLLYDKSHTWVFREMNGMVRVGIDSFLTYLTGVSSRVILKDENSEVKKGEPLFTMVHKGKQLTVKAPVTGIIRSLNTSLNSDLSLMNESPYNGGWVYVIEPTNWKREIEFLSMADQYKEWIKCEFQRFKEFIHQVLMKEEFGADSPVLQDGGEIVEHVLTHVGPKAWEEFQSEFLDSGN